MKRTKRAYDPARPDFTHFENDDDEFNQEIREHIADFLSWFKKYSSRHSLMRIKLAQSRVTETVELLDLKESCAVQRNIQKASGCCAGLFFQPFIVDPLNVNDKTWFGWADTGSVHPSVYKPHPVAFWETSPGNFQAVWKWERGLPVAASTARVEALLHEFGGKFGSHQPDAYLRVPGVPNFSTYYEKWPIVRLRYNAFPIEDAREQVLIEAEELYMTE